MGRLDETRGRSTHSEKAYLLYRTIRNIVQKARRHAALDFQYSDNYYNKNLQGPYLEEGNWVFTLINCPKHKFSERFQGPYKIIKKISDHLYVIEMENSDEKLVNISKLKRYVHSKFSPQQILDPKAMEFIPATAAASKCSQRTESSAELAPLNDSDPISIELEVVPDSQGGNERQGTPATANEETATMNAAPGESVHVDTWFDEDDTVIVEAPDTDPISAPVLRRSTRTTHPIDRFQAGF